MKPDIVALLETMEVVTQAAQADVWKQGTWIAFGPEHTGSLEWQGETFCGTAGCFAGWRAILDGAKPRVAVDGYQTNLSHPYLDFVVFPDGSRVRVGDIGVWARKRFGITDDQAEELFSGRNKMEDLERIVDEIVASTITEEQLPVAVAVGAEN